MKNALLLLAIAFFTSVGAGCSDNSTDAGTDTSSGNVVTAKKNGAAWNADVNVTAVKANNQIMINASSGLINREVLILNIMNSTGTGDQTMTQYGLGSSATFSTINPNASYASLDANSGSLKITKLTDTRIEGTFSVTVKQGDSGPGVINFTEGKFGADLK